MYDKGLVYNKNQEEILKFGNSMLGTVINYAGNAVKGYQKSFVVTIPCSTVSEESIQFAYEEKKTVTVGKLVKRRK